MRKVDFELEMKKDLSNIEIEGVQRIANTVVVDEDIPVYSSFGSDNIELAFTSSSTYAIMNVMEGIEFYPSQAGLEGEEPLSVSHFGITENNMLIMFCEDSEQNSYQYEIEPKDF